MQISEDPCLDDVCARLMAVARATRYVNKGVYKLGTGDWNFSGGESDCFGFACCYAWDIKRHRPGFNNGPWATVSDDLNCDSALEDAAHKQELFHFPERVMRGDLLVYRTIPAKVTADGKKHGPWIGHVGLIERVPPDWVPGVGKWHELGIIQCCGPNGRNPGIIRTDGSIWDHHDATWGSPDHPERLSLVVRVKWRSR